MVDAKVQPSLSGHLALPVAAGVIVDQLFLLWHPEQLTKLGAGLFELVCVVIVFNVMVLVVLCDDPLRCDGERHNGVMSENQVFVLLCALKVACIHLNIKYLPLAISKQAQLL